ncbi:MAG: hypothetical protein R3E56_09490 [Burkholderiaceae bacterium]
MTSFGCRLARHFRRRRNPEVPAATVDEALLTGESHPVTKQREGVVAGSFNLAGPLRWSSSAWVATRVLGRLFLMEKASTEKPRLALLGPNRSTISDSSGCWVLQLP